MFTLGTDVCGGREGAWGKEDVPGETRAVGPDFGKVTKDYVGS